MNKEQFLAEPERGWFLQATENYQIDQFRADVGASFGWTERDWYTDDDKLIKFLDTIEQNKRKDQLLYALKEAASSDDAKLAWLKSVDQKNLTDSAAPPQSPPPPSAAAGAGPATAAPTASATTTPAAPPASGVAKKSVFKKAQPEPALASPPAAPPEPASASEPASPPGAPPAPASGVAKKSIFKKAQPATASPATEAPTAAAPAGEEGLAQVQEEIKVAMERLSDDELSSVAQEAGVSAEELKVMLEDPEFAQMVAEERVKLSSGGA